MTKRRYWLLPPVDEAVAAIERHVQEWRDWSDVIDESLPSR
ncbi:MAG: hypothetical protein ACRDD1_19880 [Planctomycetia bacterium]